MARIHCSSQTNGKIELPKILPKHMFFENGQRDINCSFLGDFSDAIFGIRRENLFIRFCFSPRGPCRAYHNFRLVGLCRLQLFRVRETHKKSFSLPFELEREQKSTTSAPYVARRWKRSLQALRAAISKIYGAFGRASVILRCRRGGSRIFVASFR